MQRCHLSAIMYFNRQILQDGDTVCLGGGEERDNFEVRQTP